MGVSGQDSPAKKILLSSVAAAAAESATFPIDAVKTRLQLHAQPLRARHVAAALLKDGAAYRGLSPAVLRHVIYTPLRILAYEHIRAGGPADSVLAKALSGGLSGVLAQVAASPADLVKVRMQAGGPAARYAGAVEALGKIAREEGVRGLWRGVLPNAQRAFLVNMGELACYDQAKRRVVDRGLCREGVLAHTLASFASGLCATALSCPADVVKTRMMNGAAGTEGGSWACLCRTVRSEGLRALWKGFLPTWARLGPWQFVFWVTYEQLRHAAGLSPF
ncbi:mitochondrial substrate carrier family protein [Wolffia australiana]